MKKKTPFSRLLTNAKLWDTVEVVVHGLEVIRGKVMSLRLPDHMHDQAEMTIRRPPYTGDGVSAPGTTELVRQDMRITRARIIRRATQRGRARPTRRG